MMLSLLLLAVGWLQQLTSLSGVNSVQTHRYEQILPKKIAAERQPYYDSAKVQYREYVSFTLTQPVDHRHPSRGHFDQRIEVQLTDPSLPVVMLTEGYSRPDSMQLKIDPIAQHLHANVVSVEHRYFGKSCPADTVYRYLSTYQAAADLHRVYRVLRKVFPAKWLATGTSKSGITTTLYAYYFPQDMQLYVPFMAPFCNSRHDLRVGQYITHHAGTPEQRDTVHRGKIYALQHVPEMAQVVCQRLGCDSLLTTDTATLYANLRWEIMEHFFHQWSYVPVSKGWVSKIPTGGVPADSLVNYFIGKPDSKQMRQYQPIGSQADKKSRTYPYYIQAMQELGHYIHDTEAYTGYGVTPYVYTVDAQVEEGDRAKLQSQPFDDRVMRAIVDRFIPTTRCRFIFVYGANDPWTGAAPTWTTKRKSRGASLRPNIRHYLIREGVHSPYLNTYVDQTQVDSILSDVDRMMR